MSADVTRDHVSRAEHAALAARVERLEHRIAARDGARDQDDYALVHLLPQLLGRGFLAAELLELRHDERAAQVLDDLSITTPATAACWLRRMRDHDVDGLRVERGLRSASGHEWRVVAVPPV